MRKATREESIRAVVSMIGLRLKRDGKPPMGEQRARMMAEKILDDTKDDPIMIVEDGDKVPK